LNVIEYLSQGLVNDALKSNHIIAAITHGVVYSLISILVTAFEPARMGLSQQLLDLMLVLFKQEIIASMIWKEGFDSSSSGLAGHLGSILATFPANLKDPVMLMRILATASKFSAERVFDSIQEREIFAEAMEEVPGHQVH
jgi:hypothetical protein